MSSKTVYCIIVTHNGSKWIEKCLSSLNNSSIKTKVIVIDNLSTDNTVELVKENFPECTLIETGANLGFGSANNIGLSIALKEGADYVFLLNQDAWIESDTIDKLILAHRKNEAFDIISPFHLNGNGDRLDFLFSVFIEPRKCPDLYSDIYCNSVENKIYEVEFVNASAWLLTRKCISTIGGFSPVFYHYGEDNNYCIRANYHNVKIGIYPYSQIFHDKHYKNDPFKHDEYMRKIIELNKYSRPDIGLNYLNIDLRIYAKATIKYILKLNFSEARKTYSKFKNLRVTRKKITPFVLSSRQIGPNFLND
jgi:N-acetylglucosaminyl-diphospho-decaprenol L-rhamnosyltransferase